MRFGLMADFRIPPDGSRAARDVYHEIIDHLVWSEYSGFGDVQFLEHHFTDDDYLPSP